MKKGKTDPVETPEGEALPVETPPPARQRVTYQTGCGGSVVIGQATAEPESTEEHPDAG